MRGCVLMPRDTWPDSAAYDAAAQRLARMFEENFAAYAAEVDPATRAAGPKVVGPLDVSDLAIAPPGEG